MYRHSNEPLLTTFHDPQVQQRLLSKGSRDEIIGWLGWNDRNGTYNDRECDLEEMERLTLETARETMRRVLDQL